MNVVPFVVALVTKVGMIGSNNPKINSKLNEKFVHLLKFSENFTEDNNAFIFKRY